MADVRLNFVPPELDDLTKLLIYESDAADGTFSLIETVTAIGTYPNYISEYVTENAAVADDWFAIKWEDTKGWQTEFSEPLKGGTGTAVAELISRILLRDPSINENVARQEAEAALETVFPGRPVYSIMDDEVTARQYSGMTLLAMARAQLTTIATSGSDVDSFVAGLVSIRTGSTTGSNKISNIAALIAEANKLLGLNFSVIMLLEEIEVAGGAGKQLVAVDQSRLIFELE